MTTLVVHIEEGAKASNIAAIVRQLRGVLAVKVKKEETFERIPGLPYTHEERLASVRRGVEDARAGRVVTIEQLEKKMAAW